MSSSTKNIWASIFALYTGARIGELCQPSIRPSLRTANNKFKQNGISEEIRCEFVGHAHDTTNTKHYTENYSVNFLHDNVLPALKYDFDFSKLRYKPHQFTAFIKKELARSERKNSRKSIQMMRKLIAKTK